MSDAHIQFNSLSKVNMWDTTTQIKKQNMISFLQTSLFCPLLPTVILIFKDITSLLSFTVSSPKYVSLSTRVWFCFVSFSFWDLYKLNHIPYILLCWPLLINITFVSLIDFAAGSCSSFIFHRCIKKCEYMAILFIQSTGDGHLDCYQFLTSLMLL